MLFPTIRVGNRFRLSSEEIVGQSVTRQHNIVIQLPILHPACIETEPMIVYLITEDLSKDMMKKTNVKTQKQS
jgi:hypothetical protein